MDRYEVFKQKHQVREADIDPANPPKDQWYWRLVAKNNQIVAQSEGYNRRSQAITSIDRVRKIAQTTAVIENLGRGEE